MPTAFVTGASRGIGKGVAISLAEAGYDVAITARTVHEGEAREHSSTVQKSDTRPLPGSLDGTAAEVEQRGQKALPVAADLLDRDSLTRATEQVVEAWGQIDVLVNNGRYIGPGHMDRVLDTPLDLLDVHLQANVLAPLHLVQLVLPAMLERGDGTIVHITSGAGYSDPPGPPGEGGWGLGYGMSKAAAHRIAPQLAVEYGDRGVHFYNVQPGFVTTERMVMDMAEFGFDASTGAPPAMVGAVVVWLVREHAAPNGSNIEAQETCSELNLLPGWSMPTT